MKREIPSCSTFIFFDGSGDPKDLHSSPSRPSTDLGTLRGGLCREGPPSWGCSRLDLQGRRSREVTLDTVTIATHSGYQLTVNSRLTTGSFSHRSPEVTMTERHPPIRDPHLEDVAAWHPIEGTPTKKKVAIGCSVGATIETYDFIGFGIAAALYFNTAFFPADDPLSGTLLSFATLGIGFAVRPLGGILD